MPFIKCYCLCGLLFVLVYMPAFAQPVSNQFYEQLAIKGIVGVGETSHGSGAIANYRCNLAKRLLKDYGFKQLFIEADYWGVVTINNYLLSNELDSNYLKQHLLMGLGYIIYFNQAYLELFEWIKNENMSRTAIADKIQVYGLDLVYHTQLFAAIKNSHVFVQFNAPVQQLIDSVFNKYKAPNDNDISILSKAIVNTTSTLANEQELQRNFLADLHYLRALYQHQHISSSRDELMYRRFLTVFKEKGNKNKSIIFAHEAHLVKTVNVTHIKGLGYLLHKQFKAEYINVAVTFAYGLSYLYQPEDKKWVQFDNQQLPQKSIEAKAISIYATLIDRNTIARNKRYLLRMQGQNIDTKDRFKRLKLLKHVDYVIVLERSYVLKFLNHK